MRTGHSGNKVSAFQHDLDAGGTTEPQRSTRCDYDAQQGALDQPHRALTNPSDPALIPRVRRDTGAAQRRCGFNELGFAALHKDGRDIVRVRGCVKTCSEIHVITWSGNGRARHGGPLDLELHVGVLGRPRAVRGVAGLEVQVTVALDAAVPSGVLLRRGLASTRAETVPTLVLRETCGGGGGRRERWRDHLHADGGIAVLVVRLMTALDVVVVALRVLLRRDAGMEENAGCHSYIAHDHYA